MSQQSRNNPEKYSAFDIRDHVEIDSPKSCYICGKEATEESCEDCSEYYCEEHAANPGDIYYNCCVNCQIDVEIFKED